MIEIRAHDDLVRRGTVAAVAATVAGGTVDATPTGFAGGVTRGFVAEVAATGEVVGFVKVVDVVAVDATSDGDGGAIDATGDGGVVVPAATLVVPVVATMFVLRAVVGAVGLGALGLGALAELVLDATGVVGVVLDATIDVAFEVELEVTKLVVELDAPLEVAAAAVVGAELHRLVSRSVRVHESIQAAASAGSRTMRRSLVDEPWSWMATEI